MKQARLCYHKRNWGPYKWRTWERDSEGDTWRLVGSARTETDAERLTQAPIVERPRPLNGDEQ